MSARSSLTSVAALAVIGVAACNDGTVGGLSTPPPPVRGMGVIQGTVDGRNFSARFTPSSGSAAVLGNAASGLSPAIYGGPTTVNVFGTVDSIVDTVGTSRTWYIRVAMRNLLSYAIGSNYSDGNTTPPDTTGVFLVFTTLPIRSKPASCQSACFLNVANTMGLGNFTAPGQKYFWYQSRPTAVAGSPSTDTTSDVVWKFRATPNTAPDFITAFTFILTVGAAWPPPNDTQWSYSYDWLTDSMPDTVAKPRWKPAFAATNGANTLGTETWSASTGVVTTATNAAHSLYLSRHDSLGAMGGHIDATVKLANAAPGVIQAVFGFAEPAGGKQIFIGLASDGVSFVDYNQATGQWVVNGPIYTNGGTFNGTVSQTYRLRKIGMTDAHFCVGNTDAIQLPRLSQENVTADFSNTTENFGVLGNGTVSAAATWTEVDYGIGNDGGGCPP